MWKISAGLFVAMFLMFPHVSGSQKDIVNEDEFKTLCGFVSLTEQINELLERMKGKLGVDVTSLQIKAKDILFGANVDDVNKMLWKVHREMDCGQDSGNPRTRGGEALVRDLICLCEGTDRQSPPRGLCYEGNTRTVSPGKWDNAKSREGTWDVLKNKCAAGRGESLPIEIEFRKKKEKLKERIRDRADRSQGEHLYTYGGGKEYGLQTCNGAESDNDGICVMYPRGSHGDNARGIEWLKKLEDLVKKLRK
uniref:Variant surface glycoprotein 1125.5782 n=1 Tax=Trypanosoma brucei TaxID=5691 RepID=A0A1J0RDD4_9TRYP|nr:variant surface glycoprotein 1125.5782 [Trypanosoma brucei]